MDQVQLRELERLLKLRPEVWRHMVVRLDEE
jgi:ribosomal protein S6